MNGKNKLQVFATSTGVHLTDGICKRLDNTPGCISMGRFYDSELKSSLEESVAGNDVFVVGSSENALEMGMMIDTIRRSWPKRITAVISYLAYGRATVRKQGQRESITLPLACAPIEEARPDHFIILDAPIPDAFTWFKINHVHLYGSAFAVPYLKTKITERHCVAPLYDGGVKRARHYSEELGLKLVRDIDYLKRGDSVLFVNVDFDDPTVPVAAAKRAKLRGARSVDFFFNHALLSKRSVKALLDGPVDNVYVTDSLSHPPSLIPEGGKIKVVSCIPLLAETIRRVHNGESLAQEALQKALAAQAVL